MLVWFQSSTMVCMRFSLFCDVTQDWLVSYRCFRTTCWSYLQGSSCLAIEDGTNRLSQNIGSYPLIIAVKHSRRMRSQIDWWFRVTCHFHRLRAKVLDPWRFCPSVVLKCQQLTVNHCCGASQKTKDLICASFRMLFFSSWIKMSTTYFHLLALVTVLVAVLGELNHPPALIWCQD